MVAWCLVLGVWFRRSKELVVFLTAEGKLPLFPKADMASRVLEGVAKLPSQLLGAGPAASLRPRPCRGGAARQRGPRPAAHVQGAAAERCE